MTRYTLPLLIGLVIGASLNEFASRLRLEGAWRAVEMIAAAQTEHFAKSASALDEARIRLCAFPFTRQNIVYLQKRGEIEEICQ